MKITRQHLIDLAKQEVLKRANHSGIVSGYLIGSVASGDPLLGDTADIDLVLIHREQVALKREAVRLSHQVHLDISHHSKDVYTKPSELRIHPWLGPSLCEPVFLHDPEHFFEWAQAGARGQFFRPDHIHSRAMAFIKRARQGQSLLALSNRWLKTYLRATMDAANAVASLERFPVSGRRQTLDLALQAEQFDYPELYSGFLALIGGDLLSTWDIPSTLAGWARAYDTASAVSAPSSISPCRRNYYLHGFQALVENGNAEAILWPLLQIWERVMAALPDTEENESHFDVWQSFLGELRLGERDQELRNQMLQTYIEHNAAWIERWAKRMGA